MAHCIEYDDFVDHYQDIPLAVLEHFRAKATKSIKGSMHDHSLMLDASRESYAMTGKTIFVIFVHFLLFPS